MTPHEEYLRPIISDNAAVLFIDNQTNLSLVQSIDTTLLRLNTKGHPDRITVTVQKTNLKFNAP